MKINFAFFILILIAGCTTQKLSTPNPPLNNDINGHLEIVAHRGAELLAPENTYASANKAFELGATIIEFDVRMSKDSVFYVIHDARVNRTTK